jgi:predicted AAA+ superfamily ATPase
MKFKRIQSLKGRGKESCFLWGPRQTGKTTLLLELFPQSPRYNLLLASEARRLLTNPSLMRQELLATPPGSHPIIIDEVQKVPELIDEAQALIVENQMRFILCGSSARKLKRQGANLLGGRALRFELFPLVYPEIHDFDLIRALNHGLLPRHYTAEKAKDLLEAYVGEYLKEEIIAEALVRNVPAFSRFLEVAAFSDGEVINYTNIALECGVSNPTVKEYFQILEDTLLARFVPSFRKKPKRRVIESPKFYYFDVGISNFLLKRGEIQPKTELFGKVFEHFIFQELVAHSHYSGTKYPISYWRTANQMEVDFILGDHEIALEIKSADKVDSHHFKGLKAFAEEYKTKHSILVSMEEKPRKIGDILVLPWRIFLERLWSNELI